MTSFWASDLEATLGQKMCHKLLQNTNKNSRIISPCNKSKIFFLTWYFLLRLRARFMQSSDLKEKRRERRLIPKSCNLPHNLHFSQPTQSIALVMFWKLPCSCLFNCLLSADFHKRPSSNGTGQADFNASLSTCTNTASDLMPKSWLDLYVMPHKRTYRTWPVWEHFLENEGRRQKIRKQLKMPSTSFHSQNPW